MVESYSTIIYLRTSTEEQNPENQLKACKTLCVGPYLLLEEQQSAYKDDIKERPKFSIVLESIKRRECKHLIVWGLDRIYRNRKKLIGFFELCKAYKCKVHSFMQKWLEDIHTVPEPWNEILHRMLIQVMGWLAEEESRIKSERVKAAVRKEDGVTKSHKGNKWGRKAIPEKTKTQIVELHEQGKSYREICLEVYYWDGNNHRRQVSMGFVHKTIVDSKRGFLRKSGL